MAKKVILIICSCVVGLGLMVCLVGFALGGRTGAIRVSDNDLVFQNSRETVRLGSAPAWARGRNWWFLNFGGRYYPDYDGDDYPASYHKNANGQISTQVPPVSMSELHRIDIDIAAGVVTVVPGDEARVEVSGPLEYTSYYHEDAWHIETVHQDGLVWRNAGLWLGGQDVTTTFTITVPASLDELDLSIGAGKATLQDVKVGELNCDADAGSLKVKNVTAATADFGVDAGEIVVTDATVDACGLDCDAGSIVFGGEVQGTLDASCDAGSIGITVPRPADYGWSAKANMGTVRIDGQYGVDGFSSSTTGGNQNARPYFTLECNMGDIDLSFD